MGLFERPQLSAAIHRHLPALFAANGKNMRWKRFFFKQVCDLNGGLMCKTPNCGECSDYALCFGEEE
jgi:nitrogen fixation protein NifQ